jgi:ankyrin repeat protein
MDKQGSIQLKGLTAIPTKDHLPPRKFPPDCDVQGLMKAAADGPLQEFLKLWDGVNLNSQVDSDMLVDPFKHNYLQKHAVEAKSLRMKYGVGERVVLENALTDKNGVGDAKLSLHNALIEKYGVAEGMVLKEALTALHPGRTALHMAATNGQWEIVKEICAVESVQVNLKDIFGYTALHLASLSPHPNRKLVIEQLMEKNVHDRIEANVESHAAFPDPDGNYTPLHFAVRGNFKKVVEMLLEWKPTTGKNKDSIIDVGARSKDGWTPLHLAVKEKLAKEEDKIANAKAKSIIRILIKFINKNCPETINTQNEEKKTPLHTSVASGDYGLVDLLLDQGEKIKPELKDMDGNTPLDIAIQKGDYRMVQKLQNYLERVGLYGNEKAYADAASAILVVAALIATVTFTSWSQITVHESTLFWVFSSLSFYFAVATLLSGAGAAMPSRGSTLANVRSAVYAASVCLAISLSSVIGAFATAAFVFAPLTAHDRRGVIATTAVGGFACLYFLVAFVRKLAKAYSPLFLYADYTRKTFVYKHVTQPLASMLPKTKLAEGLKSWYKDTVVNPKGRVGPNKKSIGEGTDA